MKVKCKGSSLLVKMLKDSFGSRNLIEAIKLLCIRDLYLMDLPEEL